MGDLLNGTVDVPGAGPLKKRYLAIPAGLAVAYVGWRWYQARQDASAEDPSASGLYSTDDLTDMGLSTTGGSGTVTGNTGSIVTDATGTDTIDSNVEWTNKALELLGNQGYDGQAVSSALGEFLARRALDKSEATIARAAMGVAGQPPENRPWSVIEEAGTGTGTLNAPSNLRKWDTPTDTQIGIQWEPVPGAPHYRIFRNDLGTEPIGDSYDTKFWARGLTPNHSYSFHVAAVSTDGKTGKNSNTYTGRTAQRKLAKPATPKASAITKTSFRVSVAPVKGAELYRWYLNGKGVSPSDQPYRDFTGMKPNTTYHVSVAADLHTQAPGPTSNALSVKTKR
jgi:hypothetical protein